MAPFSPAIVLGLVGSAVAPMAPLLLFKFSLQESVLHIAKLLLG